jgi:SAM-dependent methyltransferase
MGHILSHYRNQGVVRQELLEGIDYTVQECLDCALIFQKMVPEGEMLGIIYDGFVDQEKLRQNELSQLTTDNFRFVARRLTDLFALVGKAPRDISLLDFGFGYGRWARVAVGMGARVCATEISPEKIAFAQSIGVRIISEQELPGHRFDIIHTEQVFEHLTQPLEVFDKLVPCIAANGVFKIGVPRQGRIRELLRTRGFIDWSPYEFDLKSGRLNDYNTILPLEHLNSYSTKAIQHLARRGGLRLRNGPYGSRHLDLDLGSPRSFAASCRDWSMRLLKELYVATGPGLKETGYYLLHNDTPP